MIVTLDSETRHDTAHRGIHLIDAPTLTYAHRVFGRNPGNPGTVERTWRPTYLRLTWRRGKLSEVAVRGNRLRKDGSEGVIADSILYRQGAESGLWLGREEYHVELREPPEWLAALIAENGPNVPPFDAE